MILFVLGASLERLVKSFGQINWFELEYFDTVFWLIAVGWSGFLATYAFQLHTRFYNSDPGQIDKGLGTLRWCIGFHQFILNFLGGIVGFIILYFFARSSVLGDLGGWEKIILMALAFVGVTGYLPYLLLIKPGIISEEWLKAIKLKE